MVTVLASILIGSTLTGSFFFLFTSFFKPVLKKMKAVHRKAVLLCNGLLMLLPLPWLFGFILARFAPHTTNTPMQELSAAPGPSVFYSAGQALQQAAQTTPPANDASHTGSFFSSLNGITLIVIAYIAITAVILTIQILQYKQFIKKLVGNSQPVTNNELLASYQMAVNELSVKNPPELLQSAQVHSPLLTGFIHPRIILPAAFTASQGNYFAFQHELTHHKNHDMPFKLFFLAIKVLHWFNPVSLLLCRQFNDVCEEACDEALSFTFSPAKRKAYAVSLLSFTEASHPYLASGFSMPAKQMKTRLEKLLKPAQPKKVVLATSFSLLLCLLAGAIFVGCSFGNGSSAVNSDTLLPTASSSLPNASSAITGNGKNSPDNGPSSSGSGKTSSGTLAPTSSASSSNEESSKPASNNAPSPSAPSSSPVQSSSQPADSPAIVAAANADAPSSFTWPVPGQTGIARSFGDAHRGMDIMADKGAAIVAAAGGTITTAEYHYSYGNYVVIDHGGGLTSLYAHCDGLSVEAGQTVTAGQQIATVGATGNVTGPVLHLEFQQDGTLQNPSQYVAAP